MIVIASKKSHAHAITCLSVSEPYAQLDTYKKNQFYTADKPALLLMLYGIVQRSTGKRAFIQTLGA